jgi:hypothetical protein
VPARLLDRVLSEALELLRSYDDDVRPYPRLDELRELRDDARELARAALSSLSPRSGRDDPRPLPVCSRVASAALPTRFLKPSMTRKPAAAGEGTRPAPLSEARSSLLSLLLSRLPGMTNRSSRRCSYTASTLLRKDTESTKPQMIIVAMMDEPP